MYLTSKVNLIQLRWIFLKNFDMVWHQGLTIKFHLWHYWPTTQICRLSPMARVFYQAHFFHRYYFGKYSSARLMRMFPNSVFCENCHTANSLIAITSILNALSFFVRSSQLSNHLSSSCPLAQSNCKYAFEVRVVWFPCSVLFMSSAIFTVQTMLGMNSFEKNILH